MASLADSAHVYRFPSYDFFIEYGATEFDLLNRVLETPGFKFMPGGKFQEQTVKMTNFFFLDREDNPISFEELKKDKSVYLHGVVKSWDDGCGEDFKVGNIRVKKWLVYHWIFYFI